MITSVNLNRGLQRLNYLLTSQSGRCWCQDSRSTMPTFQISPPATGFSGSCSFFVAEKIMSPGFLHLRSFGPWGHLAFPVTPSYCFILFNPVPLIEELFSDWKICLKLEERFASAH